MTTSTVSPGAEQPRKKGAELSPYVRAQIEGARRAGGSLSQIAQVFGVPRSTVQFTLLQASRRSESESLPRPGRPGVLSTHDGRLILRIARRFPEYSAGRVLKESGVKASLSTVKRFLGKSGVAKPATPPKATAGVKRVAKT